MLLQPPAASRPGFASGAMPLGLAIGTAGLLLLALFAFWPQYLSRPSAAVDAYTHVHAAIGIAWVASLIAQPLLVHTRRMHAHRFIGRASYLLAPAFVVSSLLLAHHRFSRMTPETFAHEAYALYLPLSMALLFGVAYGLGLAWRRDPASHARFMAATATTLIDPVVGRVLFFHFPPLPSAVMYQAITFGIVAVVLVAMQQSLPARAPGRAAYTRFTAFAVTVLALWFVLPRSGPWLALAAAFRSLPLT